MVQWIAARAGMTKGGEIGPIPRNHVIDRGKGQALMVQMAVQHGKGGCFPLLIATA
jgi:hypothetical protein